MGRTLGSSIGLMPTLVSRSGRCHLPRRFTQMKSFE